MNKQELLNYLVINTLSDRISNLLFESGLIDNISTDEFKNIINESIKNTKGTYKKIVECMCDLGMNTPEVHHKVIKLIKVKGPEKAFTILKTMNDGNEKTIIKKDEPLEESVLNEVNPWLVGAGIGAGAGALALTGIGQWRKYRAETLMQDIQMVQSELMNCYLKNKENPELCAELENKMNDLKKKLERYKKYLRITGTARTILSPLAVASMGGLAAVKAMKNNPNLRDEAVKLYRRRMGETV